MASCSAHIGELPRLRPYAQDPAEKGRRAIKIMSVSLSFFRKARERNAEIVDRSVDVPLVVPDVSCLEYS